MTRYDTRSIMQPKGFFIVDRDWLRVLGGFYDREITMAFVIARPTFLYGRVKESVWLKTFDGWTLVRDEPVVQDEPVDEDRGNALE